MIISVSLALLFSLSAPFFHRRTPIAFFPFCASWIPDFGDGLSLLFETLFDTMCSFTLILCMRARNYPISQHYHAIPRTRASLWRSYRHHVNKYKGFDRDARSLHPEYLAIEDTVYPIKISLRFLRNLYR